LALSTFGDFSARVIHGIGLLRPVIACALDGAEHLLHVVAGLFQPGADHLARTPLAQAKRHQDRDRFSPKLMTRIRVNGRSCARRTFRFYVLTRVG
jgi:hypothetical protein